MRISLWVNLHLPQDPRSFHRHQVADCFPLVGQGFSKQPQDRICEPLLCRVVLNGTELMHNGPKSFNRVQVWAIGQKLD